MNEFVAKKLGEVLAFSRIGVMIFQKGEDALQSVLEDQYTEMVTAFNSHAERVVTVAQEAGCTDITLPKSDKTGDKLTQMAEMYIGDQWDNPAELMEWLGFFEGAAIVHWKLVHGAAMQLSINDLVSLSNEAIEFHTKLFNTISSAIEKYAVAKVS